MDWDALHPEAIKSSTEDKMIKCNLTVPSSTDHKLSSVCPTYVIGKFNKLASSSYRENEKNSSQYFTDKMKTSIAYIIAAALFGATQAAITPMNNIIRHEYNLNARAGVHGNIERDVPAVAAEGDVLQPIV
ncbi:hypothetical protein BDP67DRAFT_584952 [Colletotrichum lupini]|nr:hypothetical protein BDP67DRAFT_584952 [Colletotrichum lupini]